MATLKTRALNEYKEQRPIASTSSWYAIMQTEYIPAIIRLINVN